MGGGCVILEESSSPLPNGTLKNLRAGWHLTPSHVTLTAYTLGGSLWCREETGGYYEKNNSLDGTFG